MADTTLADTTLTELVAGGDQDALAALYQRHGPACYRLARQITASGPLAEDAVQEAFAGLWQAPRSYAWNQIVATEVRAALRELPESQRQSLTLAYFAGYTQSQIAELTGVPLGTVKTRMFTGMRRMRVLLAPLAALVIAAGARCSSSRSCSRAGSSPRSSTRRPWAIQA